MDPYSLIERIIMENESPEIDEYSELIDDILDCDEYSELIDDILDCDCQAPVNFISNYIFENSDGDKAYGAILMCTGCQKLVRISGPINKIDDITLHAYNRMEIKETK